MTKRERVLAAMDNKPVDKAPMGFWYHFSPDEDQKEKTVKDHLDWFKGADLDFIKVMCDGYFNYPNPFISTVKTPEDWFNMTPLGENSEFIENQVWRAKRVVEEAGSEACVFYNVFNPMSQLRFGSSEEFLMENLKADKAAVMHAFKVISEDTKALIRRLFTEAHVDGIYFCVQNAEKWRFSVEEYNEIVAPLERELLEYANSFSEYNMLHCCGWAGDQNNLEVWKDYPAKCVNWAVYVEKLSLKAGKEFFGGKCVLGGFDNTKRSVLYTGTKEQIKKETIKVLKEAGTTGVMLGADCSIPSDIPWENIRAVGEARDEFAGITSSGNSVPKMI